MFKILIADYEDWFNTESNFVQNGFQIETAEDTRECQEKLRKFCPDLLILEPDIFHENDNIDGLLTKQKSSLPIDVILISQNVHGKCVIENTHLIKGRLAKPVSVKHLAPVIFHLHKAHEQRRWWADLPR